MRLINADELKRVIHSSRLSGNIEWLLMDLDEIIDNAPTVEECKIIDGLNNEIDDLSENLAWYVNERNRLLKERRPQGKWRSCKQGDIPITDRCTNCNYEMRWYRNKYNFCPNCGADMRGEK